MIHMAKEYRWAFSNRKMPPADTLLWLYKSFVLNCPVSGVSCRAKTFADLGFTGTRLAAHQRKMKECSGLTSETWQSIPYPNLGKKQNSKNKMKKEAAISLESLLDCKDVSKKYRLENEFAYYYNAKDSKTAGLYYLIRNALAHGSFCYHSTAGNEWLVFETKRDGKLRGRAILRLSSLKQWAQLLHKAK